MTLASERRLPVWRRTPDLPMIALGAAVPAAKRPMHPRKHTIVSALLGGLLASALPAQEKSQDELKAQRTEKLAKEVFKQAPWTFDYDAARAEAKKTGKPILAYFTRSYAH